MSLSLLSNYNLVWNVYVDDYTRILETITIVGSLIGLLSGIVWYLLSYGRRFIRVVPTVDKLHDLFGPDPIEVLHELVKDSQAAVGEIEIRQRIAERHLQIGIYVCSPNGKCSWANDYLCNAFGLDSSSMHGYGWLSAVNRSDQHRVHTAWTEAITKELPYREEYGVVPQDGEPRWRASTVAEPVIRNNKIVCYVGYVTRIS
jgi:PAS domain-containing protein